MKNFPLVNRSFVDLKIHLSQLIESFTMDIRKNSTQIDTKNVEWSH